MARKSGMPRYTGGIAPLARPKVAPFSGTPKGAASLRKSMTPDIPAALRGLHLKAAPMNPMGPPKPMAPTKNPLQVSGQPALCAGMGPGIPGHGRGGKGKFQ